MRLPLFERLFDLPQPSEGARFERHGRSLVLRDGVVTAEEASDEAQAQTGDIFGFKWGKRDTYRSDAVQNASRAWLRERYGDLLGMLDVPAGENMLVLDAGCGSAFTSQLLFENDWSRIEYVGVDISSAVHIAADSVRPLAASSVFIQSDLMKVPLGDQIFDLVLSEGVLHHTPSTRDALMATARLVRPGGVYAIYVYAKKSPVREFTDDYVRSIVSGRKPQMAWDALMPLTKLGAELGKLDLEIDVPEEVTLLGIPKGRINLQRLFYWHICKMYYRPDYSLEEMNHVNFDWFAPKYAHRQTADEVRRWLNEAGFDIERLKVEEAGITAIARRPRAAADA